MSGTDAGDTALLEAFERGDPPEGGFGHREHVRVAWLYLRRLPAEEALAAFSRNLRRFAARAGQAGLYHETITWAYVLLIRERMEAGSPGESWDAFAARNADLLTWRPSVLSSYYRDETLRSDLARRVFVLPDRAAGARPSDAEQTR